MEAAAQKAALRQRVLALLKSTPLAQRAANSAALREQLFPLMAEMEQQLARPLHIALYAALPHEVNLLPLLHERPQHLYAFPRCHAARHMSFHRVTDPGQDLAPGAMGIATPGATLPCMEPADIDLLLVPGVAFSPAGERLGYGGGYYDSFIPRCPQARVLALAFAEQMVSGIPTEPHDLRLPLVLHL